MIRLYTAVGICESRTVQGKRRIFLQSGGTVYYPRAPEMLLWGEAMRTVLTYEELESRFYHAMTEAHLSVEISFDWYVEHLVEVGVLARGQDETLLDARYDLFKGLYLIAPGAVSPGTKLLAFCRMLVQGYALRNAARVFRKSSRTGLEREILRLVGRRYVTTAELVRWLQLGAGEDFYDAVYGEVGSPQSVEQIGRLDPDRHVILDAVVKL